ncbi:unnamed protein product [Anisakis simplex]|uniref:Signal sequence receptor subunit gamma n=1 Tax=Anisakis simplex TaxID=6269 RepID=A0A0M3JTM0_ANISI|nr:unnamed protein product [Anisakis simplex]
MDRSIINFHLANLEYAIGTTLENSSMKDWNQDDDYELDGPHCMGKSSLFQSFLTFSLLSVKCFINFLIDVNYLLYYLSLGALSVTISFKNNHIKNHVATQMKSNYHKSERTSSKFD